MMITRDTLELEPLLKCDRMSALDTGPYRLADWSAQMLAQVSGTASGSRIVVCTRKPRDVGLPQGGTWSAIDAAFRRASHTIVPVKLIPGIRRAFTWQPAQSMIRIMHSPVLLNGGQYRFSLRYDGQHHWLHGRESGDDDFWPGDFDFLVMAGGS